MGNVRRKWKPVGNVRFNAGHAWLNLNGYQTGIERVVEQIGLFYSPTINAYHQLYRSTCIPLDVLQVVDQWGSIIIFLKTVNFILLILKPTVNYTKDPLQ